MSPNVVDLLFLLCVLLTAIDILLLYAVVYVIGHAYSFFFPWRVLLIGAMVYCFTLLASDCWWYLMYLTSSPSGEVLWLLARRCVLSGVIWSFSWSWWRGLERSTPRAQ